MQDADHTVARTPWRIELFGGPTATRDGATIELVGRPAGALLALLALDPGRPLPRESLTEALWPELDDVESARNRFKQTLAVLRRALEPDPADADSVLYADRRNVTLLAGHTIDLQQFRDALRDAARAEGDESACLLALRRAVELSHRPLVPGLFVDSLLAERERLGQRRRESLRRLARLHVSRHEREDAAQAIALCVAEDPGDTDALALDAAIRSLPMAALPQPASADNTPVVAAGTVAAAVVTESGTPPANGFFGRDTECERLIRLLEGGARLVTVTGLGGAGKTRLVQELLAAPPAGFDRCTFVPLEAIRDGGRIEDAIADAFGIATSPLPARERIAAALSGLHTLAALDNLEQLVDSGAPEHIDALLLAVPGLSIIATSRRRLDLAAEREVPLAPLEAPGPPASPARLIEFPSVALFVDRARSVRPEFELDHDTAPAVASLCRLLDGLPLAIELAAARCGVLSPAQIAERLSRRAARLDLLADRRRDRAERHRSLRAALNWSAELLPPDTLRFLYALSVFCGGFTLDDAEAITGDDRALEGAQTLRDASLLVSEVRDGVGRLRLLETVRVWADERLDESGERALMLAAHARHFARTVIDRRAKLVTADGATLSLIDRERENIDAALVWLTANDVETALLLCASLGQYWQIRALLSVGRHAIKTALAAVAPNADVAPGVRADALNAAGVLAHRQGDPSEAVADYEAAITLWSAAGDNSNRARTLGNLAGAIGTNDATRALALYEEALALREAQGNLRAQALLQYSIGWLLHRLKRYADARARHETAIPMLRAVGDRFNEAQALGNLGDSLMRLGELSEATDVYRRCLELGRAVGAHQMSANVMASLADIALENGDPAVAAKLAAAWEGWCERNGIPVIADDCYRRHQLLRDALGSETAERLYQESKNLTLDEAAAVALQGTIIGGVRSSGR